MENRRLLSIGELASKAGCSRQNIYNFIKDGRLVPDTTYEVGGKSKYLFNEDRIDDVRFLFRRKNALHCTAVICVAETEDNLTVHTGRAEADMKLQGCVKVDNIEEYIANNREILEKDLMKKKEFTDSLKEKMSTRMLSDCDKYVRTRGDEALDVLIGVFDSSLSELYSAVFSSMVVNGKVKESEKLQHEDFIRHLFEVPGEYERLLRKYNVYNIATAIRHDFIGQYQKITADLPVSVRMQYKDYLKNDSREIITEFYGKVITKAIIEEKLYDFFANVFRIKIEYMSRDAYQNDLYLEFIRELCLKIVGDDTETKKSYYRSLLDKEDVDLDVITPTLLDVMSNICDEFYPYGCKVRYINENGVPETFVVGGKYQETYENCKNAYINKHVDMTNHGKDIYTLSGVLLKPAGEITATLNYVLSKNFKRIIIYGSECLSDLDRVLLGKLNVALR